MKKIVALFGIAAAVYGAKKLLTGKDEQAIEPSATPYGSVEYGSSPQG